MSNMFVGAVLIMVCAGNGRTGPYYVPASEYGEGSRRVSGARWLNSTPNAAPPQKTRVRAKNIGGEEIGGTEIPSAEYKHLDVDDYDDYEDYY